MFFLVSCSQSKEYYKVEKLDLAYYKKDILAGNNSYVKLTNIESDSVDGIHIRFGLIFLDSLETVNKNLPANGFLGSIEKIDTIYFENVANKHVANHIDSNVFNVVFLLESKGGSRLPCNNVFQSLSELKSSINNKDQRILRSRLVTDGAFIPFNESVKLSEIKSRCIMKFSNGRVVESNR